MNSKYILAVVTISTFLTGCQGSYKKPAENGYNSIKGTVTSILSSIIPSAHASDITQICSSRKSSSGAGFLNVYLVQNGIEEKICDTDILSNGSFEIFMNHKLIPENGIIKMKSQFNGNERETLIIPSEVATNKTNLEVNPLTTVAAKILEGDLAVGNIDRSKIARAKDIVKAIYGEDIKAGINTASMAYIINSINNSTIKNKIASALISTSTINDLGLLSVKTEFQQVKDGTYVSSSSSSSSSSTTESNTNPDSTNNTVSVSPGSQLKLTAWRNTNRISRASQNYKRNRQIDRKIYYQSQR